MSKKDEANVKKATSGLFAGMVPLSDQLPGQQSIEADYPEAVPKQPEQPKQNRGKEKQRPLSVWMDPETKAAVKAYSTATDKSVSLLMCEAVKEYMERHRLTGKQAVIYEALLD